MVEAGPREPTWVDPIAEFMKEVVRPEDRWQERKLQSRCARYTLINEKLYRRGYSFSNLKCVIEEEGKTIMGKYTREYARIILDPGRWYIRHFEQCSSGLTWAPWRIRCQHGVIIAIGTPTGRIPVLLLYQSYCCPGFLHSGAWTSLGYCQWHQGSSST